MKKKLLILAVAGLALASCSNDETVAVNQNDSNVISFRPNVSGQTRSLSATTLANFTTTNSFFVEARNVSNNSSYFAPTEFLSDGQGTPTYKSAKTYYWPATNLNFYAWYPNVTTDGAFRHANYNTFTMIPDENVTSHVDYVIAATLNRSKSESTSGVPLAFKHLGSWIEVKVYNSKGTSTGNLNAIVSGWKIGYLHKGGVYTIAATTADGTALPTDGGSGWNYTGYDAVNASNVPAEYKVASLTSNYESGVASASSTPGNAVSIGEAIIVPQTTTKMNTAETKKYNAGGYVSGAFIALQLKIQDTETTPNVLADATGTDTNSHDLWAVWPVNNDWVAGTKYTYTIDVSQGGYKETGTATNALDKWFEGTEIFFSSVTVTAWPEATAGSISF